MADEERWPLVDMVSALSDQLREAQRRAGPPDGPGALLLKECTVQLGMSWDKKADGGVQFWVVKLGGGLNKSETETITVVLEPGGGSAAAAG
jgi:Trypsin-co-occurring domain 2